MNQGKERCEEMCAIGQLWAPLFLHYNPDLDAVFSATGAGGAVEPGPQTPAAWSYSEMSWEY